MLSYYNHMNENTSEAVELLNNRLETYEKHPDLYDRDMMLRQAVDEIFNVMQKYNGYTNYETWAMDLWLSNDYGTYNHIKKDIVPECEEEAEYDDNVERGIWTKKEAVKYCVADRIKDMVEEEMPEVKGVWSDFLNASLSEVDWDDVAEGFLEE